MKAVFISSKHPAIPWVKSILNDWGIKVVLQPKPAKQLSIIVMDYEQESICGIKGVDKIVLTNSNVSSEHLLALSSALVTFGQKEDLFFPNNLPEMAISNGIAIMTIQTLINQREQDHNPQIVYTSCIDMVKYYSAFFISAKYQGMISKKRGQNILEGGAPFYAIYPCKQGHIAVGNLQPKFYAQMIRGLPLDQKQRQFCELQSIEQSNKLRNILTLKFKEKTATQWERHFMKYDTCITEVKRPFRLLIRQPKLQSLKPKL